ncbi:putative adhesin [Amycolatopsis sp. NBC_00438]|uniref:putative adhesin n=1 Tax=Amycolatopsis sp. NBC_00438 TaxID=2903558 RepID=UPI002E22C119
MRDLIVSGHGSFDPKTDPPRVKLGAGQRLKVYQEPLHLLSDEKGRDLEQLVPAALEHPVRTFEPGEWCPNYTITPPFGLDVHRVDPDDPGFRQLVPDRNRLLAEILADGANAGCTVYWAACLAVRLNSVGGNTVGVNTGWDGTSRDQRSSPALPAAGLVAEVRARPDHHPSTEDGRYVDLLARHAYPSGGRPTESVLTMLAFLAAAARRGPAALIDVFAKDLNEEDRRGFLLNDTFRWWLAENGLRIPGEITDPVLRNQDPRFWTPGGEALDDAAVLPVLAAGNAAALAALEPDHPVQAVVTPSGLLLVGGEHPAAVIEYVTADPAHAFAAVNRTVVDGQPHLVVIDCPPASRGPVYQALGDLGEPSIWFDVPPGAVAGPDTWDWDDLALRNRSALDDLWRGQEIPFLADDAVVLLGPGEYFTAEHIARVRALGTEYEGVLRNNVLTGYDVTGCPPHLRAAFAQNLELAGIPAGKLDFVE